MLRTISSSFFICRELAVFYPGTEHIAEDAPEVFMPRVGKEAPRVGEHSNKCGKHTEVSENVHLLFNTVFVIAEPPSLAELNFSGEGCSGSESRRRTRSARVLVLETAHEGTDI